MTKMKLALIISIIAAGANAFQDGPVFVQGVAHTKEILYDNNVHYLTVDLTTDNVFYYALNRIVRYNLNTKEIKYFKAISAQCVTIHQASHDVYVGNYKGIYKYRQGTEEAELAGVRDVDVFRIHYNKVLYYNKFYTKEIYSLINGYSSLYLTMDDSIKLLLFDDKMNIYVSYDHEKLYCQKGGYKHLVYEGYVTALASDKYGKVHICADDGIYQVQDDGTSILKVAIVECYNGLAFDKANNIIYSSRKSLIRLKPTDDEKTLDTTIMCDKINDINNQLKSLNDKVSMLIAGSMLPSRNIHLDKINSVNLTLTIGEAKVEMSGGHP